MKNETFSRQLRTMDMSGFISDENHNYCQERNYSLNDGQQAEDEGIKETIRKHMEQIELLQQRLKDMKQDNNISPHNEESKHPSTSTRRNIAPCLLNKYPTYRKLPGSIDFGKEFEQTMCGFYALNLAVNDEVKDFQMTSNNDEDGKFDDIGLKVTFTNGKSKRFLFQLKHKENKSINIADLMSESKNNDFGVKKYFKSITEMNVDEDTVCILYSNCSTKMTGKIPLTDEISLEQCERIEFEEFLVNTKKGCQNAIFQVQSESLKRKFYFFTSQLNVQSTEEQVNAKLKNLLQCDIHAAFTSYMKKWWSGKFVLMKQDVIAKISELAFSPYLKSLSDEKCNEKTENLKQAIMSFPLTIVEDCGENIVENIWKIEETWADEDFSKVKNKFALKEHQVTTTLWYLGKLPLVVKANGLDEGMTKSVMNFLRKGIGDKKIVLIGEVSKNDFGQWETLESLWDIVRISEENHNYSDIMQKFYISFQKRGCVSLKNLVRMEPDVARLIGTKHLLKMSQAEHLLVGNQKEELSDLHIPRFISPVFVKTQDVLSTCRSSIDMLVIFNCDETSGNKLSKNTQVSTMELSQYMTRATGEERANLVLLCKNSKCTNLQFEEVCEISNKSNVCLVEPFDDEFSILLLKKSEEFKFESAQMTKAMKESEIFNHYDSYLHVLCAPPGMGKSTLMKLLCNSCPSDCLAVYVGLINYNSFLATEPDFDAILNHFLKTDGEGDDLFQQLKVHFCQKRKLYMFLDGLDEVNSQHVERILDFVKQVSSQGVNVWLSSRVNLREKIRQTLNVVSIDIEELGKEEQREYIYTKLKKVYTDEEIEKISSSIFSSTDLNNSQNLLGIPLQLHIITEMFLLNDRQVYENMERKNLFVLTQMYRIFFEGKIKFTLNKLVDQDQQLQLGYVNYFLQAYEIPALKACLSFEDYQKLNLNANEDKDFLHQLKTEGDKYGIVKTITENDEVIFSHQTYAEYFAAAWFKKNKDKIVLLQGRMFSSEYYNLRLVFDVILAEKNPLHLAIIYQDLDGFENHIEDVGFRDDGGRTASHLAFTYGQKYQNSLIYHKKRETPCYVKMTERLLQEGKLLEEKDDLFGLDCVSYALQSNCLYPIEKILEKKLLDFEKIGSPLYRNYDEHTVASYSARFGYSHLLSGCIKKHQPRQDLKHLMELAIIGCEDQDTPTTEGNVEAVKTLIESGAPLDNMLNKACYFKRFDMLEILIKAGPKCNPNDRKTILHILVENCREKHYKQIESVIESFDIRVNARDSRDATAIHYAAQSSDSKILEALIENGADLKVIDVDGRNVLHYAAKNFRPDVMKLLLNTGLTVNAVDRYGSTPLHLASQKGETEIVQMMLNHGADPKLSDNGASNALHYASSARKDNSCTIPLLVDHELRVNQPNQRGLTPLHLACQYGHFKNVEILLERGADPNLIDKKGDNALHHAVMANENFEDLLELLIKKGVDVNAQNHEGTTPLHKSAEFADLEIVVVLEENGADLNILDYHGRNVLHYASNNYKKDLIKSFLNRSQSVVHKTRMEEHHPT